jgi:hypothetical protein
MQPEVYAKEKITVKERFSKAKLNEFANHAGVRLGGVRGREKIFNFLDLETLIQQAGSTIGGSGQIVEYDPLGPNVLYFEKQSTLTETALFKRFEGRFADPAMQAKLSPSTKILGQTTLQLIAGLLTEIDDQKWISLNANPDTRQLIQTSLFQLMQHLGKAENSMDDFTKFAQEIELAHCEIATLLALTTPFEEKDFPQLYLQHLHISKELQELLKIGISKSAMNVFAGINSAIKSQQPQLERVYAKGSYFEIAQFIGWNRSTDDIIQNPSIDHIDLYVGEFNQNLNIDPKHNEYHGGDIQGEIESLLQAKSQTQYLTVAIDCTIDYVASDKVSSLLNRFSKEIEEGKLNFVFLRSGQKFDMLGMDNYYGAPFYIINNGDKQWKSFDVLTSHDAYQTDLAL